jgi:hypothetical protein
MVLFVKSIKIKEKSSFIPKRKSIKQFSILKNLSEAKRLEKINLWHFNLQLLIVFICFLNNQSAELMRA